MQKDTTLGAVKMATHYEVVCRDKDGNLKWIAHADNLVVNEGLTALVTACFKTIPGSVTWYLGLKGTANAFAAADTMASHVNGWTELTAYDEATRPEWVEGTVTNGSVSNTLSKARFTASGSMTVVGLFMTSNNTKGGTTGTLYGGADFSEGSRAMVDNDTLDVTATVSATAS